MKEPLINIQQILSNQNNSDSERDNGKWNTLPMSDVSDAGANGIMDIIGKVRQGMTAHYVTDGAWSLYQLLIAAIDITGPAVMYTSTYAMSETSARCIANLKDAGLISGIHCVIDDRVDTRSAGSLQLLRSIADSCALVKCHAKATVLQGKSISLLILGSANYTENKRLEIGIVTTNPDACEFHKNWIITKTL